MADIAHQIVLRYGVKAPYLEVAQEIERVIDCAFDGGEFNDVTFMSSIVSYDEPTGDKLEAVAQAGETALQEAICGDTVSSEVTVLPPAQPQSVLPQQPQPTSLNAEKKEKNQPSNPQKPNMITKLCNYLKTNYTFRYNILTNKSEMKREGEEDYIVIGKREKNTIVLDAQQAGLNCWDKDVERIIESTGTPTYHPFTNYFDHLPKWDGKDRVSELAKRVSEKEVWVSGFHRWMLSATAQWMNIGGVDARANCVAPLLISTEQGWGKSTFCRILLPEELQEHYTENFNLAKESDCDKELGRYGIINLDEFDKFSANKMPKLKNLMQKQALHVRHAYERNDTNLHRIASFIGTSNRRDLLTDPTGSRRFLCVELEKQIDCQTPIEYSQLYAQLKEELLRGERTYFTKEEERKIQLNNRPYYSSVPELEAFHRHYRMASQTDEGAEFMTSSEIYKRLQRSERAVMRGATANRFARLLTELGEKVHTNLGNGYYVKLKD
jgi:hypothetical protein